MGEVELAGMLVQVIEKRAFQHRQSNPADNATVLAGLAGLRSHSRAR